MKNPSQAACRTVGWAAAVVALGVATMMVPRVVRAQATACAGDCDGSGDVTVNEVITLANIVLETEDQSACSMGIPEGETPAITLVVTSVNSALTGCPGPVVCGNGLVETGEDCDNGGTCIGGTNAGDACTAESDCEGTGVCDTFGTQGPPGTQPRKVCSTNSDCGGANCIHCKTFGGQGCAANCTTETEAVTTLVPGELIGLVDVVPGTSTAFVHGDPFNIPLALNGTTALKAGKEKNGKIPIAQNAIGVKLDRIPIASLACACVRGSVYMTCGGVQFEADGLTAAINCTRDATICTTEGKSPCAALAGPGNSGEGVIGCEELPTDSYTITQDAGGAKCPNDTVMCPDAGPQVFTFVTGQPGGPGSQIMATASAIGNVVGLCSGTDPTPAGDFYGPDGEFCTDDDPDNDDVRGIPSVTTLVTGTATITMQNANGVDGLDFGPFENTGKAISCQDIEAGMLTGAEQAGGFTALDNPTLFDIAVVNVFVAQ
jgi:hypothetical protein